MKKWIVMLLTAVLLCVFCAGALAAGEGSIVQSSCNIIRSGDYYLVYCYAQVHNDSDHIICLDEGTFELSGGEQLLYSGKVSQLWPYFIAPGEDGYLFDIASFEPNEDGVVVPNVTGIHYDIRYMSIDPAYAGQKLDVSAQVETGMSEDDLAVICEVGNPMPYDAYDATVSFGLYTDSGALIYADGRTLSGIGIPAGEKIMVRFDIDELFAQQWRSYGVSAQDVRATAMFRSNDD